MSASTYRQIDVSIRVKEFENGEPYLLIEQKAPPEGDRPRISSRSPST